MNNALIAPCGMNCGICFAYLREKNKCAGCRGDDANKPITRVRCKIKQCAVFQKGKAKYCFECGEFPCENLNKLDKRYRKNYDMSMVENLEFIQSKGLKKFEKQQNEKYSCVCGGTVCVHNNTCYRCGTIMRNIKIDQ